MQNGNLNKTCGKGNSEFRK